MTIEASWLTFPVGDSSRDALGRLERKDEFCRLEESLRTHENLYVCLCLPLTESPEHFPGNAIESIVSESCILMAVYVVVSRESGIALTKASSQSFWLPILLLEHCLILDGGRPLTDAY
jgi:hypothetical protein